MELLLSRLCHVFSSLEASRQCNSHRIHGTTQSELLHRPSSAVDDSDADKLAVGVLHNTFIEHYDAKVSSCRHLRATLS